MAQNKDFLLPLKSMTPGEATYEYHLGKKFFADMESVDITDADLDVVLTVNYKGDIYNLNFSIKGNVTVECDRCLEDMKLPVDTVYDIAVEYGDAYDDESDTLLVIPHSDNSLDVAGLIYDTVELAVPMQHVHEEGDCDEAMSDILNSHIAEDDDVADPRWAELKKLSDNNDNNQPE